MKGRLRRLERKAEGHSILIPQPDGTARKFPETAVMKAFLSTIDRMRAHRNGEELPLPHPLIVALRTVREDALPALMSEHGTMLGHFKGEDEIYEGLRERPGPPVTWSEDGTTCF